MSPMKRKHTPGPWMPHQREYRFDEGGVGGYGGLSIRRVGPSPPGARYRVATVTTASSDADEQRWADAWLLSAAPDLLDAAEKCRNALSVLAWIDHPSEGAQEEGREALSHLEMAIKKALGRRDFDADPPPQEET